MSLQLLPEYINPLALADKHAQFYGGVLLTPMLRLQELIVSAEQAATVKMDFGVDQHRLRYIQGQATADISLLCQRCMQPFNYHMTTEFNLSLVANDDLAAKLPEYYEPLIVTDDPISLTALIEDELILSLPIVASHSFNECPIKLEADIPEEFKRTNPFSELKKLK